jgi:hypothetical protein
MSSSHERDVHMSFTLQKISWFLVMPPALFIISLYHMTRSVIMFTKQGFTVIPPPTYYLSPTPKKGAELFIPRVENFKIHQLL